MELSILKAMLPAGILLAGSVNENNSWALVDMAQASIPANNSFLIGDVLKDVAGKFLQAYMIDLWVCNCERILFIFLCRDEALVYDFNLLISI